MAQGQSSLLVTGRTWVTGALANRFSSRALVPSRVQTGDMKLWCHLRHQDKAPVWAGQFRAAIYDGKAWRTFRLNIVADADARYDNFGERDEKAQRCFLAIAQLRQQEAHWFENTYGCTFTIQPSEPPQPVATPPSAARASQQPAIGSEPPTGKPLSSGRTGKGRENNGQQLLLFE